jgi:hypothetical protein
MGEVIEVKTATFSMLEESILLIVMKEDAVVDVPASIENYHACRKLTKGNRFATLVDATLPATITKEARDFSSDPEQYRDTIAQAVIVISLANRILANFIMLFLKRNRTVEMKLFSDYNVALNWVREKIKEDKQNGGKSSKSKKLSMLSSI